MSRCHMLLCRLGIAGLALVVILLAGVTPARAQGPLRCDPSGWIGTPPPYVCENTADITVISNAIEAIPPGAGDLIVRNSGALTTGDYQAGIYAYSINGDTMLTNSGAITTGDTGTAIYSFNRQGDTMLTNSGAITTGDTGTAIYSFNRQGSSALSNSGAITTGAGGMGVMALISTGSGALTNSGAITTGDGGIGIMALTFMGRSTLTNTGAITAGDGGVGVMALTVGGSGSTLINSGTVTVNGSGVGLQVISDTLTTATVNHSGAIMIRGDGVGLFTGPGGATVTTSGDITVTGVGAAIDVGDGDDTVIIEGLPTITGLIDGGPGWDRLAFSRNMDAASFYAANDELNAILAAADPAGGTITFMGQSYTYANFEELLNWLQLAMFRDGRINPFDFAASATGYCAIGGAQLYIIHPDGQGEWVYNTADGQVQAALAEAQASGAHVLIAERLGVQLWALADRSAEGAPQLQLVGPDGYAFLFPANTCGFTD